MTAKDKADTLNLFFSGNFTEEKIEEMPENQPPFLGENLDSFVITPQMVKEKIEGLKSGKSPGPDGWHPIIFKNLIEVLCKPLSILFQKSLCEGIVSSRWLEACITPIHKKVTKTLVDNYRPVTR